jgi:serine/threonine-protein kinase RsbW
MIELVIHSDLDAARAAEEEILQEVERQGYRSEEAFAIRLSLEEAITNAVKHGNKNDPSKHIRIRYRVAPDKTVICVADDGTGFDPNHVPDPTSPARLSLPNGRGIMLMRAYMDEVHYSCKGNEIRLVKKRTQALRGG